MANETANATGFDPQQQVITLVGSDGQTSIPVPVPYIDFLFSQGFASEINYGTQIGASIMMLLVLILMTPRNRFSRIPTLVNILGLILSIIRCVLLSLFFTSSWFEFYTVTSGDYTYVATVDYNISVVATALSVPIIILIEAALAIQAWSMIKLWPSVYKWSSVAVSAGLVMTTIAFKFVTVVMQSLFIVWGTPLSRWARVVDLALSTTSISWFCFLFIVRLVIHMYTHRSILPSAKGLSAMEVLVMTNGVLMLIPVVFSGLEFGEFVNFESGSLTYTSVFLVLPLGTLMAQRIANPAAFSTNHDSLFSGTGASKQPFLKSWHSNTTSSQNRTGVTTYVASDYNKEKMGYADSELARIDHDDLEGGVRVNRTIEHREQHAL